MARRRRKNKIKSLHTQVAAPPPVPQQSAQPAPKDVQKLQQLGANCYEAGDIKQAAKLFAKAYELAPQNAQVGTNYAQILIAAGLASHALAVIKNLLDHHPQNQELLFLAGNAAYKTSQAALACSYYKKALDNNAEDADILVNLAIAEHDTGDFKAAESYYNKALEIQPSNFAALYNFARLLMSSSRFESAAQHAQKALALKPEHIPSMQIMGVSQMRIKQYSKAEKAFKTIIAHQPDSIDAAINLCVLYDQTGHAQKGYDLLAPRAKDWPDKLSVHAALLNSAFTANLTDKAKKHGRRALEIKHIAAKKQLEKLQNTGHKLALTSAANNTGADVLAFSLWGNADFYNIGAIENAKLAKHIYPGWEARFYIDNTVPETTATALKEAGANVVVMPLRKTPFEGLMWRFNAANDPAVRNFMCRDCDCRLNMRERAAVDEWLASAKDFFVMRDHVCHAELILAGLWGGKAGLLPVIEKMIYAMPQTRYDRWGDQTLLANIVWPLVYKNTLVFDSTQTGWLGAKDFPPGTELPNNARVGDAVKV